MFARQQNLKRLHNKSTQTYTDEFFFHDFRAQNYNNKRVITH